jgi:hypothetical protein
MSWAGKQLERLQDEVLAYVHTNPYKFMPQRYSPAKDEVWGKFVAAKSIPPDIPLLFGDTLLSTQSCLDYLIWDLIEASGQEKPSISNQFSIVDSRVLFEEEIGRKRLRGVPFPAIAIIEQLQPYHSAKGLNDSALYALKTLANIYKHRFLPLTVLAARRAPADIKIVEIEGETYAEPSSAIFAEPFDANTEFGPFKIVGDNVDMEGNFVAVVALKDTEYAGREIISVLLWIWFVVKNYVIPEFEKFFV